MKNKLLLLIKKDFYLQFSFIDNIIHPSRSQKPLKERLKNVIGLLVILAYASIINCSVVLPAFKSTGVKPEDIVKGTMVAATFFSIMFTLASSMSNFFFSDDIKILTRLPIKIKDIIAAKIVSMSLTNFIIYIFIAYPAAIKYGLLKNAGILYYLFFVIGSIAIPLIITSIISLVTIFIMQYITKIPNLKNKFQFISLLLGLVFFVFYQMVIPKLSSEENFNIAFDKAKNIFKYLFPFDNLFQKSIGLIGESVSILSLIILVGLCAVLFYLTSNHMVKPFLKGFQQNRVSPNKKKKVNIAKVKSTSVTFTIAKKEMVEIIKTPIYLFNTMMTGLFLIIIFFVGFLNNAKEDLGANGGILNFLAKVHEKLYLFISDNYLLAFVIAFLVGFALALISGISNDPSATSISREGKNIRLLKSLPISGKDQIKGRILAAALLKMMSQIPLFILLMILLGKHLYFVFVAIVGFALASFFISNLGLFFDIRSPKLKWDTPQQAIKQNMNVLKLNLSLFALGFAFYFVISRLLQDKIINILQLPSVLLSIPIVLILIGCILFSLNVSSFEKYLVKYDI